MDCRFVERSISDYLSGDLAAPLALDLEKHLGACPDCEKLHREAREPIVACRSLPDLEARDELWHLLRPRLEAEGLHSRTLPVADSAPVAEPTLARKLVFYRRVAYAALATAAASLSLWIGQFLYVPAPLTTVAAPAELAALEIRKAELHYMNAIESLTGILDTAKEGWNPEVRRVIEQNLRTIDRSIAECQAVLRREPRNLEAGAYLLAAYSRKVDLLKSVLDQPAI